MAYCNGQDVQNNKAHFVARVRKIVRGRQAPSRYNGRGNNLRHDSEPDAEHFTAGHGNRTSRSRGKGVEEKRKDTISGQLIFGAS